MREAQSQNCRTREVEWWGRTKAVNITKPNQTAACHRPLELQHVIHVHLEMRPCVLVNGAGLLARKHLRPAGRMPTIGAAGAHAAALKRRKQQAKQRRQQSAEFVGVDHLETQYEDGSIRMAPPNPVTVAPPPSTGGCCVVM